MTIWMKQMKRKTREAQATYAPNLESTCLEYCMVEMTKKEIHFRHVTSVFISVVPSEEKIKKISEKSHNG